MRSWVDHFVPPALRADHEAMRRARLTVLLSAVLLCTALAYAVFYAAVVGFATGAVITGGGAGVAALMLAALRLWPRFRAGGHALTGVLYLVLVALIQQTGGLPSLVTPWLIMPSIFAALLLGRVGAAWWTSVSLLTIAAFYVTAQLGVPFPTGFTREWTTPVTFASYLGLVASTAVLIWVFEDVRREAQRRAEAASAALARLAYHDALTGLVNRTRFLDCLGASLERARADGAPSRVVVLLLDLDGFKGVNDSLGHAAGDALLAAVAARLLNATRGCDTVARLGGDEFAVLLDDVRENADVDVVAGRICAAVGAPFTLGAREARVSASVGVARGAFVAEDPADAVGEAEGVAPPRRDIAAVLHDADVAMYRAKRRGKGRWVHFEPGMHAGPEEPAAVAGGGAPALLPARLGLATPA
jgi:diguanylate cyclase (GGDEF)-like protein